ncbi:CRYAA protein, partial [Polyodon spathula]|nr:CRYAA protein [Polyodon spathula]
MDIAIQHPWFRRALGSFYPSRLFDQFFGEGFFDYDPFPFATSTISPYYRQSLARNYLESINSGISEVNYLFICCGGLTYILMVQCSFLFIIECIKYMQVILTQLPFPSTQDDHGYISREFHRRYRLPSNVDQSVITCSLSSDGLLTFCGPKIQMGTDYNHRDRNIPVTCEEKPTSAASS